ncbi:MAG: ATP-binding cassette domain-containing protein [Bacteroidetes bacterium]|nr:ATP-binding cassette domain-containing protein [Bacteroidota bacterium]
MIKLSIEKRLNAQGGEMLLQVDLEIEKGKILTLYGDSGAGKTSILRMIAGLMDPDNGSIEANGVVWFDQTNNIKPQQRKVGYVFQDHTLFPNKSVRQNLEFALNNKGDRSHMEEMIDAFELSDLQDQKPNTLSSGQQQRVALARALVNRPEMLMLDEALSALDMKMRSKLQDHILRIRKELGLTIILVSHEVGEIFKMSDKVIVLEHGKISRQGTAGEVFSNRKISGKFQFTGEVTGIVKEDVIYIITVLIANNLVKVVADESTAMELSIGDKVLVASKAFNPMIRRID